MKFTFSVLAIATIIGLLMFSIFMDGLASKNLISASDAGNPKSTEPTSNPTTRNYVPKSKDGEPSGSVDFMPGTVYGPSYAPHVNGPTAPLPE